MLSQSNTATFLPGLARFALPSMVRPALRGLPHPAPVTLSLTRLAWFVPPRTGRLTHFPSYGQKLTSGPAQSGDSVRLTYFYRKEQRK